MRVLLDTNIIIHRENHRVTNYTIGHLYRWLDKLNHDKIVHPFSIEEMKKYDDSDTQKAFEIKLQAYNVLRTIKEPDDHFLASIGTPIRSPNDRIDNFLLYEVYLGRVDILITEDRQLRQKAHKIGLSEKVVSINEFISRATAENPELVEYKMLAVQKICFGNVNIDDVFFDSFRAYYPEFDRWFARKCDEEAYICRNDLGEILGFLYLKIEREDENYSDIAPPFKPLRRLKIGTFKVESTGFRLGERFVKIIFDNAMQCGIDEIYITLFNDSPELAALVSLLMSWGFTEYGTKKLGEKYEKVFIKKLREYDNKNGLKWNFPNIHFNVNKFILPIYPQYHTSLLPDSKLNNENNVDFLGSEPHKYALLKAYITWAELNGVKPGDLILFYRIGPADSNKKYTSVLTSLAIVEQINGDIKSEEELFKTCQNRSVFSAEELHEFWIKHCSHIKVIRFIFVKSLTKRLTLEYLWNSHIITAPSGPRPFTQLNDSQYLEIMRDSMTEVRYFETGGKNESTSSIN